MSDDTKDKDPFDRKILEDEWQQNSHEVIIDQSSSFSERGSLEGDSRERVSSQTESFAGQSPDADPWSENEEVTSEELAQASRELKGSMRGGGSSGGSGPGDNGSDNNRNAKNADNWQEDVVNRLAFASLNEQRRGRRWGIFFKSLAFAYIGIFLFYLPSDWSSTSDSSGRHTALIDISGVIAADTEASADRIVTGLRAAFKDKNTVAVILRINSPGGSPVQAGYVYDEIRRLREKYKDTKLYAVASDICASGGYYIAVAADEIYADKASLIGSIGVLMNGFGFVDTMKKLGVERRLLTAGAHKGILDPFSAVKKEELAHVQGMIDGVHQQFIDVVKQGRGDRLKETPEIFSGLFWNGEDGLRLGLVDGLGSAGYVAREIIGAEKIVDFTAKANYFDRFADRIGVSVGSFLSAQLGLQGAKLQ
ncbi:MAG: S49 family peptidase [Thiohalomonadales bacterium]